MNKKLFSSFNYLFSKISEKSLSRIAIYLVILVFFISYQFYMLGYIQTIFAASPIAPAPGLRDKCIPPAVGDWVVDSSCTLTWYSTSWKFRKPITVNNSLTSALTDYQVYLQIETNSLISAGKMNSDCSDIRFTYYNSTTQAETVISHWLESGCNTGSTSIWVKVPSIPASGNSTIYMYYGNPSATGVSNGTNTFILWDNFDDGSISDWTQGGTPDVTGTQYVSSPYSVYCGVGEYISKSFTAQTNFVVEYQGRYTSSGDAYDYSLLMSDATTAVELAFWLDWLKWLNSGSAWNNVYDTSVNTWYKIKLVVNTTSDTYDIYVNGILRVSGATFYSAVSSVNTIRPCAVGATYYNPGYVDDVIIRKYASPEPSCIPWHEETIPKNILVKSGGTLNLKTNYNLNFTTFWTYRRPITVSNSGSAQTDYPVNVSSPIYNEAGLVGSWHFGEGSGTSTADSSGNNNAGTVSGASWTSGKYGSAMQFDGVNDYVDAGNASSLNTAKITISAWIKPNTDGTYLSITGRGTGNAQVDQNHHLFSRSDTNKLAFYARDAVWIYSDGTVASGSWSHVAVTYDGTNVIFYINGQASGIRPASYSSLVSVTNNLRIGRQGDSTNYFNGTIDEVQIYNRALSASEISALYNAKARLDYADVRFTYYNSTDATETELNYWMQTDGNFWVKDPYIASGSNTIYVYYGNPTATSASNGDQTFNFFDDFTGTVISTDKWVETDNGNYLSQNDKLIATGGSSTWTSNGLYSVANFGRSDSLLAQWEYKPTGGTYFMFGWKDATTGWSYTNLVYGYYDASTVQIYEDGTARGTTYGSWLDNNVYKIKMPMKTDGGVLYQRSSDGGNSWETSYNSNYSTETPLKIGLINWNGAFEIDNLFVRKYASTEPTTSFGSEETNPLTGKYIYIYSGGNIYIYTTAGIQQRV